MDVLTGHWLRSDTLEVTTMKMLRLMVLVLGLVALTGGCIADEGNGEFAREVRQLKPFLRVKANGFVDVRIIQGQGQKVEVQGDGNLLDCYETRVKGETLHINVEGWVKPDIRPLVIVRIPTLRAVESSGTGDVEVSNLNVIHLDAETSGTGDITIHGTATSLDAETSGTGDLHAANFACLEVLVRTSGTGDAAVHAAEMVEGSVSGTGNLKVYGNPVIREVKVSGLGNLIYK
jgi:hypothetical protein